MYHSPLLSDCEYFQNLSFHIRIQADQIPEMDQSKQNSIALNHCNFSLAQLKVAIDISVFPRVNSVLGNTSSTLCPPIGEEYCVPIGSLVSNHDGVLLQHVYHSI